MPKDLKNLHSGHRQRLKERANNLGIKALPEHEILEILLGYCIPYRDTNELAHTLINEFGSLSGVFTRSIDDLCQVKGISEHTAFLLHNMPFIFEKFMESNKKEASYQLNTISDCIDYFRQNFIVGKNETFYIACLNSKNYLIKTYEMLSNSPTSIKFDMRYVTEKLIPIGTTAIILFHTHPVGNVEPTASDLEATSKIMTLCYMLGITTHDHIIINENDYYSFGKNGIIQKNYFEIAHSLGNIFNKSKNERISSLAQSQKAFDYS